MTDIEIWKTAVYDSEIYEGLYKVSNLGRILSLNYKRTGKAKLMNPSANTSGYLQVDLWKDGKPKTCLVHRLVATAFLDNPENLPCINHKDKVKTNNSVENIEWCSYKYNNNYDSHNEKLSDAQINDPNKSKKVLQFTLDWKFIREWPSTQECGRNGFNQSEVAKCCRGELKTHKGFRFMYK